MGLKKISPEFRFPKVHSLNEEIMAWAQVGIGMGSTGFFKRNHIAYTVQLPNSNLLQVINFRNSKKEEKGCLPMEFVKMSNSPLTTLVADPLTQPISELIPKIPKRVEGEVIPMGFDRITNPPPIRTITDPLTHRPPTSKLLIFNF